MFPKHLKLVRVNKKVLGLISTIISIIVHGKLFRTNEMRLARWKLENHSDTYDFTCCPHNFFLCVWLCEYVGGGGGNEGKGLQCTQLGDEVNKYSNLEEFSWNFVILKELINSGAANIYFSNTFIKSHVRVELRLFERIFMYMKMHK